jgi:ABC-type uncharacterized transport system substrate-binding protein
VSEAELQDYADDMVGRLGPHRFYTKAGEGIVEVPLASMDDARMRLVDGRLLLTFGLEPQAPYPIRENLEVAVFDPEYYTAFTFSGDAVSLDNAPSGCAVALEPPRPLPPDIEAELYALPPTVTKLPAEISAALRGREGAVLVTCTGDGQ